MNTAVINKLYVVVRNSKKTNKPFAMLCADLGYTIKCLSFDPQLCAELCCMSVYELMTGPLDEPYFLQTGGDF